jgi:hypothetical protein
MTRNVERKRTTQRTAVVSLGVFWVVSVLLVAAALLVNPAGMVIR